LSDDPASQKQISKAQDDNVLRKLVDTALSRGAKQMRWREHFKSKLFH